jgi:hydroxymethylbilane synthase
VKNTTIRIGTRDSELALWQAKHVQKLLEDLGHKTVLVPIKSEGDIILDKPLYELGITGIFTKTLDIALLEDKIDIAVHSMKDVPTQLPEGIVQLAVLERANPFDILVTKNPFDFNQNCTIATSSLRRKAQWLHKYPNHNLVDIRGNVNTRLQKLKDNNWDGAIFASAGLNRLNINLENTILLDWMTPAPAQGALLVVGLAEKFEIGNQVSELNHVETEICTYIERQFLKTLEGGCTAPIGAYANYNEKEDVIEFHGVLFALDGTEMKEINRKFAVHEWKKIGFNCANEILNNGGNKIMDTIKAKNA